MVGSLYDVTACHRLTSTGHSHTAVLNMSTRVVHGSDEPAGRVGTTFRRVGSKKSGPWTTLMSTHGDIILQPVTYIIAHWT